MELHSFKSADTRTRGYKKKQRTRKQLLEAGIEVLANKGESMTISDVVKEAGVSNGTFYNYFNDRDELFDALAKQLALDESDQADLDIESEDPALRFAIITANAFSKAAQNQTWGKLILRLEALRQDSKELSTRHLPDDLDKGFKQGRFSVGAEKANMDIIVTTIRETIKRIVSDKASNQYVINIIAALLCSLGVERKEALKIAKTSINEASLLL